MRKTIKIALAVFMVIVATFAAGGSAEAWSWSSVVRPYGTACPGGYASDIWANSYTGNTLLEVRHGWVAGNDVGAKLNKVPTYGASVRFDVQCSNGSWHSTWKSVYRPGYGEHYNVGAL